MFATAAAVTAGSVTAMTTIARSETVQSAQREAAAELRGLVAATGEMATDRAMVHGFCTMSSIVTLHRPLPVEVSATAAARAAGAAAAMLLPTVHQADGWKNLAIGQAIGDRLAATVAQMTQDPSLLGCEEAVQALEPHASASGSISRFFGGQPPRSLVLQSAGQADALERLLEEAVEEAEADVGGAGPRAALMRNWAGVLLQPAHRWVTALDHCCAVHGRQLVQRRTRLLLCGPSSPSAEDPEEAAEPEGVSAWAAQALHSAVRLSWVGSLSALSQGMVIVLPVSSRQACIELLLPAGPVPALQVCVEPGCALLLDGRTRWRPADTSGAQAFVVFEYADVASDELWSAGLTMAKQVATAAATGVVPLFHPRKG